MTRELAITCEQRTPGMVCTALPAERGRPVDPGMTANPPRRALSARNRSRVLTAALLLAVCGIAGLHTVWAWNPPATPDAPSTSTSPADTKPAENAPTTATPAGSPPADGSSGNASSGRNTAADPSAAAATDDPDFRPTPRALSPEATRWELTPYRVTVHVAFSPHPRLTPALREEVQNEIREHIADQAGATWQATIHPVVSAAWATPAGLERLTQDQLPPADSADSIPDKQFFVAINLAGSQFTSAVREWDEVTRNFSPVQSSRTLVRERLAGQTASLLNRVFRPLLRVDDNVPDSYDVSLTLRAGSLIPPTAVTDPAANTLRYHIRPGTVLLPFFRYSERNGNFRTNQFLPWTYLQVQTIDRGRVRCSVTTGVRAAVALKQSRRVRSLAVATQQLFPETRVELQLRRNPDRKLAAHDLLIATSSKLNTDPAALLDEQFTDRRGIAAVPQYPGQPVVWIYIKSGLQLLAKLPFVPGVQEDITIDLPDDAGRLLVEGELAQIKGQLIDTIARKTAAEIRARKAAKAGDWKKVDAELEKLAKLPTLDSVLEQINRHRRDALIDAREQGNRTAQNKIGEISAETVELVKRYLDPKKLQEFQQEINALRK